MTAADDWVQRRAEIRRLMCETFVGMPPATTPALSGSELLEDTRQENGTRRRLIRLSLETSSRATFDIELQTPQGEGPFPVFLFAGPYGWWPEVALERGYMVCGYPGAEELKTLTITEVFGVSHRDQIIDFDLDIEVNPAEVHVIGPDGKPVVWQLIDGGRKLAVRTDLPANSQKTWRLMSGRVAQQPQADDLVSVIERDDFYEIGNGLTSVRVPKVYDPLSTTPKAPIQGVRFRDGSWSPAGTPLEFKNSNNEGGITSVDVMTVTVKEKGPIRAVVEVRYDITCPELSSGALKVRPAGAAHYTTTFTLECGQPSVLIETDTDLYSSFSLSLYDGVRPTQLRYCGSIASEPKYGRLEDGSRHPVAHSRPGMDAIVDLDYTKPAGVGYRTADGMRQWMRLWDPWANNTGWYWHMYDAGGKPDGNLMGIFAGAPSRLIGAGGSGPGIYNRPGPDAGITVETNLQGADNSLYLETSKRTIRFAWGIFAGTRADAPDKLTDIPGTKKQWVLHGNGINLRKLIRWQLDYPDPNPPFGAMYMPRQAIEAMIERLRTDDAYYQACCNSDPATSSTCGATPPAPRLAPWLSNCTRT